MLLGGVAVSDPAPVERMSFMTPKNVKRVCSRPSNTSGISVFRTTIPIAKPIARRIFMFLVVFEGFDYFGSMVPKRRS
jgi:hypothetical protein